MTTLLEAAEMRHTVRGYTDRPIPDDIAAGIGERIAGLNSELSLDMSLVTGSDGADSLSMRLVGGRNVRNFVVLAGPDAAGTDERLGYAGADVMLYAQTLGLNSWWIEGTYDADGARAASDTPPECVVTGIVVLGYGADRGRPHRSRRPEEVSSYEGEAPGWFRDGVRTLLLAPTARNRQGFTVRGAGDGVAMTCDDGRFSGTDLGIGRYFFELGAGRGNFRWAAEEDP